jgi:hypothetical protein
MVENVNGQSNSLPPLMVLDMLEENTSGVEYEEVGFGEGGRGKCLLSEALSMDQSLQ